MPAKLIPGTPSIWKGRRMPCQWMEDVSARRLVTRMVTVWPSFQRKVGAGIDPLIRVAMRGDPVKSTGPGWITRSNSVPVRTGTPRTDWASAPGSQALNPARAPPATRPWTNRRRVRLLGTSMFGFVFMVGALHALVFGKHLRVIGTADEQGVVGNRPGSFHSRGPGRHGRNGDTDRAGVFGKESLHVRGGHMPLDRVAADHGAVTGAEAIRHAGRGACGGKIGDGVDRDFEACGAHMFDPLAATAAVRTLRDIHDRQRGGMHSGEVHEGNSRNEKKLAHETLLGRLDGRIMPIP